MITLIVAAALLTATQRSPRLALPRAAVLAAAQRALPNIPQLHGVQFNRTTVTAADRKLVR